MYDLKQFFQRSLFLTFFIILIQGCYKRPPSGTGNNNLDGTQGLKPSGADRSSSPDVLTIRGHVNLINPIANAHVMAYRLVTNQAPTANLSCESATDDTGAFTLDCPSTDGNILIKIKGDSGGNTKEPVSNSALSISQDDELATIICGAELGQNLGPVQINPWTSLITARTLGEIKRLGGNYQNIFEKNKRLFSGHVNAQTPWETIPANLLNNDKLTLTDSTLHAVLTLGLSQYASTLSQRAGLPEQTVVNTLSLLRLLTQDISDGVFDGKENGNRLTVFGKIALDSETTRLSLAKAIEELLLLPINKSGLAARDFNNALTVIKTDTSELYPPDPIINKPPTGQLGVGPHIDLRSPLANQTIASKDTLAGIIEDYDGIQSVAIWIDGVPLAANFQQESDSLWRLNTAFSKLLIGPHTLKIEAIDVFGNKTSQQIDFKADMISPTIGVATIHYANDAKRTYRVTETGIYYGPAIVENINEAQLSDGNYSLYLLADYLNHPTDRPQFDLTITDESAMSGVFLRVTKNGEEWLATQPLNPTSESASTYQVLLNQSLVSTLSEVKINDVIDIIITATDNVGNISQKEFKFKINILPTPLFVSEATLRSENLLKNISFEGQTFERLGTIKDDFIHLAQYKIKNVSSRPVALSLSGIQNPQGQFKKTLFHTWYTLIPINPSPESEATMCPPEKLVYETVDETGKVTAVCSTQSVDNTTKTESIVQSTTEARVYDLITQKPLEADAHNLVTLERGKSYLLAIGVSQPDFPLLQDKTWLNQAPYPEPTRACFLYAWGETGLERSVNALINHGVTSQHTLHDLSPETLGDNENESQSYGYIDCLAFRNNGTFICPVQCGFPVTACLKARGLTTNLKYDCLYQKPMKRITTFISGGFRNVGDVWFERKASFHTTASWAPMIGMVNNIANVALLPSDKKMNILTDWATEAPKPLKPPLAGLLDFAFSLNDW